MAVERRVPASRTAALTRLGATAGLPSPELRRVARLAAHVGVQPYGLPMAAIHLLDDTLQHRVASAGGPPLVHSAARDSMCLQVVEGERAVYCADASREPRYAGNPNTTGPEAVRLYYATPLRIGGTTVGALCVFDTRVGTLDRVQRARIGDLAQQVVSYLEMARLCRDLAYVATHDPLTEVANRCLLSERLEACLASSRRAVHEPSLLVVDLDDFKAVNDRYGHVVGDEVLVGTAARLRESVRLGDLVARIGGDEFAVLFEKVPDPGLLSEIAERVARRCAEPYATTAGPVRCRASVGLALGQPGDFAYELLGRADAAMYAEKASMSAQPRTPHDVPAARREIRLPLR
ncbi:MAG TPA: sensor domain-containing diguanylate cyclase [Frankiaceae bacterium]|nr:sensor domain-containing diguanylate cyclase [Frankiaceae bacterium]